jgi:hypothetical protein
MSGQPVPQPVPFREGQHHRGRPVGRFIGCRHPLQQRVGGGESGRAVVVGVLAMLDQPYGLGVHAQPDQMRQAIKLVLVGEKSPVVLAACR